MKIKTSMKNFFRKYNIKKNDNIILACSGGSDSMYLLYELSKAHNKDCIIVTHFNHKLRGKESKRDENFVLDFCKKNWFTYIVWNAKIAKISSKNKIWIEEAARISRYKFLREIKEKYKSKFIFTAHHLDDKIETFMFNLIRWTKLNGLISIEEQNNDLLRPLLSLTKEQILFNCKKENINFIEDSSNKNEFYIRNYIRLQIIPKFKTINPNYQLAFNRIIDYFLNIKIFFDQEIQKIIWNSNFEILKFHTLSNLLQKECIRYVYEKTNNWTIGLSEWNIEEVIKFINNKWNYTKKEIKNMKLFKRNWKIYF